MADAFEIDNETTGTRRTTTGGMLTTGNCKWDFVLDAAENSYRDIFWVVWINDESLTGLLNILPVIVSDAYSVIGNRIAPPQDTLGVPGRVGSQDIAF